MEKKQKTVLLLVYLITIVVIMHSFYYEYIVFDYGNLKEIIFFIILTIFSESFTVVFKNISFSLSFVVTIVSYVLFGPFRAIVILIVGYLFRVIKIKKNTYIHIFNTPIYGTAFNCCSLILSIAVGNYFYKIFNGSFGQVNINRNSIPIIVFAIIYFLINMIIMSLLLSVKSEKSFVFCVQGNFIMGILSTIIMLPISMTALVMFDKYSYTGILFMIFMLSLARYTLSLYSNYKEQFKDTIEALMNAIEARDNYTKGHSRRVAEISIEIAKAMKMSTWDIERLNVAAMLHDVGKIGISDNILQKPGKLTDEEFSIIKSHPEIGVKIVSEIKNIDYVYPILRYHHERYDGKGYPDGKKGEDLPIEVYIVQLADAVDAMSSDRPYRKGLEEEKIMDEIRKGSGTQFHPEVAKIYLSILEENQ